MGQDQGEEGAPRRGGINRRRVAALGVALSIALLLLYRGALESAVVDGTTVTAALIAGFAFAWAIEGLLRLAAKRTQP